MESVTMAFVVYIWCSMGAIFIMNLRKDISMSTKNKITMVLFPIHWLIQNLFVKVKDHIVKNYSISALAIKHINRIDNITEGYKENATVVKRGVDRHA